MALHYYSCISIHFIISVSATNLISHSNITLRLEYRPKDRGTVQCSESADSDERALRESFAERERGEGAKQVREREAPSGQGRAGITGTELEMGTSLQN